MTGRTFDTRLSTRNEISPFGDVKRSGFGREGAHAGIDGHRTVKYRCGAV